MRVRESAPFVDLPPVPWCDHEHDQDTVVDLIDNPVVTGPHSPLAVATDEGAAGPRLCGTRHSASASGWRLPDSHRGVIWGGLLAAVMGALF